MKNLWMGCHARGGFCSLRLGPRSFPIPSRHDRNAFDPFLSRMVSSPAPISSIFLATICYIQRRTKNIARSFSHAATVTTRSRPSHHLSTRITSSLCQCNLCNVSFPLLLVLLFSERKHTASGLPPIPRCQGRAIASVQSADSPRPSSSNPMTEEGTHQ